MRATAGNKISAIGFVQAQNVGGGTCLQVAAISMLAIANKSNKAQRKVIILCDGQPNCPGPVEALANITSSNYQQIPIDCVCITNDELAIQFMQSLAESNHGKK